MVDEKLSYLLRVEQHKQIHVVSHSVPIFLVRKVSSWLIPVDVVFNNALAGSDHRQKSCIELHSHLLQNSILDRFKEIIFYQDTHC